MLRRRMGTGGAASACAPAALPRALLWRAERSLPTRARDRRAGRPSWRPAWSRRRPGNLPERLSRGKVPASRLSGSPSSI